MRVLLADDSKLILERLQEMVKMYGHAEIVASLTNGTDTLKAIKTLKPDLAIVDIEMPGMNGLDVLSEIRKEDKTLKFIILTFYSSDHYRKLAIQSGADYFFSKVDDFEKLTMVVAGMVWKEENDNRIRSVNN
jgi:DNA-binding NarL/FixJ family response regulator